MERDMLEKNTLKIFDDGKWKFHQRSVSEISAWEDGVDEGNVLWKISEDQVCEKRDKLGIGKKKIWVNYSKVQKKIKVNQQVFKLPEIKNRESGFAKESSDVLFRRAGRRSNEGSIVRINEFCGNSIRVIRNVINPSLFLHENLRMFSSVKKNNLRMY